jgi:hypothetical protein
MVAGRGLIGGARKFTRLLLLFGFSPQCQRPSTITITTTTIARSTAGQPELLPSTVLRVVLTFAVSYLDTAACGRLMGG